jgi:hypothetical protein
MTARRIIRQACAGIAQACLCVCTVALLPPGCGPSAATQPEALPDGSPAGVFQAVPPAAERRTDGERPPAIAPAFRDIARTAGLVFTYYNDAVEGRYFYPEIMGGGMAWFDFDQDGWLDLYVMNGRPLVVGAAARDRPDLCCRLFRNNGDGTFSDVSLNANAAFRCYGQGCAAADFNADGFPDCYLTAYGPAALLVNNGDGTLSDASSRAGVSDVGWGTSAAWVDLDQDRDLDLYVATYLDVTAANHQVCEYDGKNGYCGPGRFQALPDRVFLNSGDGTFVERSAELGFAAEGGKGLGVIAVDLDDDLRPEVFVANDMMPNFLFTLDVAAPGASRYHEVATGAGCAVSGTGEAEAGMGIACADFDGDGRPDLFLPHYFQKKSTLYRNLGNLQFEDDSYRSRIAALTTLYLGFGTLAVDFDRDGAGDLFMANGHVLGPEQPPFEMRPRLFKNDGSGRFSDVSEWAGPYFDDLWLGRGAAGADYDNDGDLDIAVSHLGRPMVLLRNETATGRHFLGLKLQSASRIPPVGGRVIIDAGNRTQVVPVISGGSYLSSSDERLLVGLGAAARADRVEVHWPSGRIDRYNTVSADRYWRCLEGKGLEPVSNEALSSP